MKGRHLFFALLAGASAGLHAQDWRFTQAAVVTAPDGEQVFPHLDASGRRSLAVDGERVAVVWEDNRSGTPHAYVAFRDEDGDGFEARRRISGEEPAYAPAITTLGDGRFLTAWEEDGRVRARVLSRERAGPAAPLAEDADQPTLHAANGRVFAAWREGEPGTRRVALAALNVEGEKVAVGWRRPVAPHDGRGDQLYPALAGLGDGALVAWEDRRHGHTRLYCAVRDDDGGPEPVQLNETPSSSNPQYGRGTGVTRVALAKGGDRLAAVWMDKRDFKGGYDIYSATGPAAEARFGPNEKAQDLFGNNTPQWHPAIAVSPSGQVVAAWDDPRDGNPDLWLSVRDTDGSWGDDFTFGGGSGPGAQTHPVVAFDDAGRLHLAWVDRGPEGARVLYSVARPPE